MASCPVCFYKIFTPFSTSKLQKYPLVRSQRFSDEGKPANNIVDANVSILRKRIELERIKERLNKTWYHGSLENGWNYKEGYDATYKRRKLIVESFELVALVGRTIGLVFLSGTFFVFLYSLLLMHIQIHQA